MDIDRTTLIQNMNDYKEKRQNLIERLAKNVTDMRTAAVQFTDRIVEETADCALEAADMLGLSKEATLAMVMPPQEVIDAHMGNCGAKSKSETCLFEYGLEQMRLAVEAHFAKKEKAS